VMSITRIGISRITEWTTLCSYPVLYIAHQCTQPIRTWYQKKQSLHALEQQLTHKEYELAQLRAELIALKSVDREAQLTEQLRGFCTRYSSDNYVIGRVIQHITTNDEQSIIIDIGAHHGVTNNMIAITHNCLVGHVEAVFPYHTKIVTIADRRSKIPIQCINSGATGIYTGINNSATGELLFISHLNTLAVDDMITTSGDGYTYPAGFALGNIKNFFLDTQALHYTVNIALLADVTKLTHVALLKSSH
jgi:rod shape-determining protein MreC